MTQPPQYRPAMPPPHQPPTKKRPMWPFILGGIIVLVMIIGLIAGISGGTTALTEPDPEPAPAETSQPADPEPEPQGPTPENIEAFIAESTAPGATTYDEACAAGISWTCNIEHATPRGGTLEVRATTIDPPTTGDDIARGFYNFLTMTDASPMPNVHLIQVTTATDGEVGSHRG